MDASATVGPLFDVIVVGSSDGSPAGHTKLASALAERHGIPVAVVARAIAAKNLRAGQSLAQEQAQTMVRSLQALGAITIIRPAAPARNGAATGTSYSALPAFSPPQRPATGSGMDPVQTVATPRPITGSGMDPVQTVAVARPSTGSGMDPVRTVAAPRPITGSGMDPVRTTAAPSPGFEASGPELANGPARPARPAPNRFAPPDEDKPLALELDEGPRTSSEELAAPQVSVAGAAALVNGKLVVGSSSSGLAVGDEAVAQTVRCPIHGLAYDRRKASGCRKCLAPARQVAQTMENPAFTGTKGAFRESATKRAFLGLAIALAIGFIPAAYYALRMGGAEVRRLRAEQEVLSRKPGTEEVQQRFTALDADVGSAHRRSARNTAVLWLVVSGGALFGWYRIT